MTGSTRIISSTANSARAPYAAPQTTASSSAASGAVTNLAPFVPREFRAPVRSDVTVVPVAEHLANVAQETRRTPLSSSVVAPAAPISELFSDDAASSTSFAAFIESHDAAATEEVELPWIDAFAAEEPEAEESWPLGEAGKRLDELTQSLSSLDASRERIEAEKQNADALKVDVPEAPLPMWNEEEWIDIMPTSPSVADAAESVTQQSVAAPSPVSTTPLNAESAARALEGLAQRVRAGELKVPAFPTEMAQEAVLAGLLASMLGWRQ